MSFCFAGKVTKGKSEKNIQHATALSKSKFVMFLFLRYPVTKKKYTCVYNRLRHPETLRVHLGSHQRRSRDKTEVVVEVEHTCENRLFFVEGVSAVSVWFDLQNGKRSLKEAYKKDHRSFSLYFTLTQARDV